MRTRRNLDLDMVVSTPVCSLIWERQQIVYECSVSLSNTSILICTALTLKRPNVSHCLVSGIQAVNLNTQKFWIIQIKSSRDIFQKKEINMEFPRIFLYSKKLRRRNVPLSWLKKYSPVILILKHLEIWEMAMRWLSWNIENTLKIK